MRHTKLLLTIIAVLGSSAYLNAQGTNTPQVQELAQTNEGVLTVVWGDPHPTLGTASDVRFSLATADGQILPLQLNNEDGRRAITYVGKQVVVSGRRVSNLDAVQTAGAAAPANA